MFFTICFSGAINGSTILPIASATKWAMSAVIQRLLEEVRIVLRLSVYDTGVKKKGGVGRINQTSRYNLLVD